MHLQHQFLEELLNLINFDTVIIMQLSKSITCQLTEKGYPIVVEV